MRRREFLRGAAWAGAGAWLGNGPSARGRSAGAAPDLDAMARRILDVPEDEVPALALGWVEQGATVRDLLGAGYLAGLREINPSPIGGQVHALMMVASASETAATLRGRRKLLPALFHLHRVKRSQARDAGASRGDWVMPAAPETPEAPVSELGDELVRAMVRWDGAAADRAVVGLHEALSLHDFFEWLWPWAARDFRIIGHKIIFAAQTYRALQDLGWRRGRDAVRSLAFGILDQNPYGRFSDDESRRILALFDHNRQRAEALPAAWAAGPGDPGASTALLSRLRESDAEGAAEAVAGSLRGGAGAAAAWDGVRLYAFELLMRHPSIAGVHTVTSVNALHRASLYTARDATRRLVLLQAASWLPLFAEMLQSRRGARPDRRIDALAAAKAGGDPFAARSFEAAAGRAVAWLERGEGAAFRRGALDVLARKAQHDHDYKFSVAALEEIAAAHPRCRPALAGASMAFLRREPDDDGAVFREVRARLGAGDPGR